MHRLAHLLRHLLFNRIEIVPQCTSLFWNKRFKPATAAKSHMMQGLEQEMTALRRVIRHWLERVGWRRGHASAVSQSLAHDLGVPPDVVSRVLAQTTADLRQLAAVDEASDARPIINKAIDELAKYGYHSRPHEEALMERCLEELPEDDLTILRHFKQGKKHREIAALMGTDVEAVRRSLVKTYADLRMKMRCHEDGGGGGHPLEPESQAQRARKFGPH
jgi:DNA-directed RNA polymerase specialized sigma subunit